MDNNNRSKEGYFVIFGLVILFGVNILFNAWITKGNRVFYKDDLSLVIAFQQSKNWKEFSFALTSQKFRPIAMFVMYIVLKISKQNLEIIDEILLLLNYLNAILVFSFTYWIIKSDSRVKKAVIALMSSILFIASHFAYYNISEVFGIMEGMGVFLAIGIQFTLLLYIWGEKEQKYFRISIVLYAIILYIHERYFVLFILFAGAVYLKNGLQRKSVKQLLLPFFLMVSFWGVRFVLFGNRMLDGTGGTNMVETFNFKTVVKYCFSQVGYILGFQCGPQYLNGISANQVSLGINLLLIIRLLLILTLFLLFVRLLVVNRNFRKTNIKPFVMFLLFISSCIVSSSITIRVEMRWIYVSYAMFSVMLVYMLCAVLKHYRKNIMILLTFLFFVLTLITEQYYREHYINLYYWGEKDFSRELYNTTVGKYGQSLNGREIIIISSDPAWGEREDTYWEQFFSPYINSHSLHVTYVKNTMQAQINRTDNSVILVEDISERKYTDITDVCPISNRPYAIYGIYADGWFEPDCKFEIYGSTNSKYVLTFYYPETEQLVGSPNGTIIVNSEKEIFFELTGNLTSVEVELSPKTINTIQILSNFWVHENTGRSEDGRLSSVLISNNQS